MKTCLDTVALYTIEVGRLSAGEHLGAWHSALRLGLRILRGGDASGDGLLRESWTLTGEIRQWITFKAGDILHGFL